MNSQLSGLATFSSLLVWICPMFVWICLMCSFHSGECPFEPSWSPYSSSEASHWQQGEDSPGTTCALLASSLRDLASLLSCKDMGGPSALVDLDADQNGVVPAQCEVLLVANISFESSGDAQFVVAGVLCLVGMCSAPPESMASENHSNLLQIWGNLNRATTCYWRNHGPLLGFLVSLIKELKNRLQGKLRNKFIRR